MGEVAVMQPPIAEAELSDDDILKFSQRIRKKVVNHLTGNGEKMPDDPKEQMVLLATLSDMDRQALTKKRIAGDNANAESDRQASVAIASMYAQLGTRSPFEVKDAKPIDGESREAKVPSVPDKLADVTLVPGELDVGIASLEYRDIVEKS